MQLCRKLGSDERRGAELVVILASKRRNLSLVWGS